LSGSRFAEYPSARSMARHVLIVDDDYESREALREMLRMWGHEVDVAADGCEAITLALERRPEVVLLDLGLPDMKGTDVAQRIRAAGDPPTLIALTGSDEDEKAGSAFDDFILKPADPEALRIKLVERATKAKA
jgi:two-component system, sensor histidine kinase